MRCIYYLSTFLWLVMRFHNTCFVDTLHIGAISNIDKSLFSFLRQENAEKLRGKRSSAHLFSSAAIENNPEVVQFITNSAVHKTTAEHKRYQVASIDFEHVSSPYVITLWILTAGLAKIGFQVTPKLRMLFPESCVLILIGVAIGLILFFTGVSAVNSLTPHVFFMYLLPPIVLDAGYFMPNRLFFDNLMTILMFAVIGTVWNAIAIGFSLWAVGLTGLYKRSLPLLHTLLFSSIVSAVDPVAVLAVFEEIHVNEILYIIVFGESLLNDAVTVVLYHMFEGYTRMGVGNILAEDYATGVASFFVVAVGGTAMGVVFGGLAAFISRFTHHVLAIEPLFVFVIAYLSYLTAELFHLSGIMALTFCGITMKNYVEENVSHKSHVTVKYTMKMLASSSETIIFVLLGVATVNNKHEWNTWFVLFSVLFCLIYRALGVVILSAIANRFRLHRLNLVEQFIMSYGGLRGAVAFALVLVIDEDLIPSKNMMLTAVISVVYFTVFFQGTTIGFFVNILNVPKSKKTQLSMNERLHTTVLDHLMAGIEGISDHLLGNFKIRDKFRYYNNKILRPFLTKNSKMRAHKLFHTHSKLNLNEALSIANSSRVLPSGVSPDVALSLSSLFKSYNEAHQNRLAPEEVHQDPRNATLHNIDLGELTYNPSFKDLADVEIHHILEDSMFKPQKKVRRYSRSEINEPISKHPPFPHQIRFQMNRSVYDNKKLKARTSSGRKVSKRNANFGKSKSASDSTSVKPHANEVSDKRFNNNELEEDEEEECLSFRAGHSQLTTSLSDDDTYLRTAVERSLPWKRDLRSKGELCPRPEIEQNDDQTESNPHFNTISPTFHSASRRRSSHSSRSKRSYTDTLSARKMSSEIPGATAISMTDIESHPEIKYHLPVDIGDRSSVSISRHVVEPRMLPAIAEVNGQNHEKDLEDSERTDSIDSLNIEGPDVTLFVDTTDLHTYKYKHR